MLEKFPGETPVFDLDCSKLLASGETITSVTSVVSKPTLTGASVLSVGTPSVNTNAITYSPTLTAGVGKVIRVSIGGGTPNPIRGPRVYSILATFVTSTGQTLVSKASLSVLPELPN